MYRHARQHLLDELARLDAILLQAMDGAALPSDSTVSVEDRGLQIRQSIQQSLETGIVLPLVHVASRLSLTPAEIGTWMLAAAPHLEAKYATVFAGLQGDGRHTLPRLRLAARLFGRDAEHRLQLCDLLGPRGRLARAGLVELRPPPEGSTSSALEQVLFATPRGLRLLRGEPYASAELDAVCSTEPLPPSTQAARETASRYRMALKVDRETVLRAQTWDAHALVAALTTSEVPWLVGDLARPAVRLLPPGQVVQALFQEAFLQDRPPALIGYEGVPEADRALFHQHTLAHLEDHAGAVALIGRELPDLRALDGRRRVWFTSLPDPDQSEREVLWRGLLGDDAQAADAAWRYRLGARQIARAARDVQAGDALEDACRRQSRADLGDLAAEVRPLHDWDALVLPDDSLEQLQSIVRYVAHRDRVFLDWGFASKAPYGQGVAVMFAGPPGTGKTMSAALVAGALGLPLFRIDLAGVVSKYIGETEKNLDRVFRAAHRSNAILFFDEADALFGKRTEVKDAHDRHANVETSYLLQQMEAFDGVTVLATNLKKNVDGAFLRRMQVVVDFPSPSVAERLRLWKALIPVDMPRAGEPDFHFLASQFELAGGHIKNVVQHAALLAAEADVPLCFEHLLQGVRRELHKAGRILHAADFGPYAPLLAASDMKVAT